MIVLSSVEILMHIRCVLGFWTRMCCVAVLHRMNAVQAGVQQRASMRMGCEWWSCSGVWHIARPCCFRPPLWMKVKLNSAQVRHKPGGQMRPAGFVPRRLRPSRYSTSAIHSVMSSFGVFAEEIGGVQFPVKLVDESLFLRGRSGPAALEGAVALRGIHRPCTPSSIDAGPLEGRLPKSRRSGLV